MKPDKGILENQIHSGLAYEELGRMYGVTGNCIKKWARKYEISLTSRKPYFGHNKKIVNWLCRCCGTEVLPYRNYCNKDCRNTFTENQKEIVFQKQVELWKSDKLDPKTLYTTWGKTVGFIREYILRKYNFKCCKCSWNEIHPVTKRIPVQVHHINGNAEDNREENLELLCPNCHSLTENFASLNNGNGRKNRKGKY